VASGRDESSSAVSERAVLAKMQGGGREHEPGSAAGRLLHGRVETTGSK